jgi:hypothetical protein
MPTVSFTYAIQRHVPCPTATVKGATVREALDAAFAGNPAARGYVLDDQGALRPHMVVFVNGRQIRDRTGLSDALPADADVHCLVQCAAHPDAYWVQHHNGIFRSVDGAQRWTEIERVEPSSFGFAVAVHPGQPDAAWFVPGLSDEHRIPPSGQVVVTRTRDGGRTFETLRRGLPQHHAYDLTYRHALDIDRTGNRLAFGTTTGSVWISEDQGDSWTTISEHLPPVYAVRFAQ